MHESFQCPQLWRVKYSLDYPEHPAVTLGARLHRMFAADYKWPRDEPPIILAQRARGIMSPETLSRMLTVSA